MLNLLVEVDLTDHVACLQNLFGADDRPYGLLLALYLLTDDELLLFELRIVDDHLEHEAVYLCLGQRIGAFLLDGVLCCQYEEGFRKLECGLADSDLTLLHGFEQSALHLGRSTVDFVGQHEVGEDGTLFHDEFLVLLTVDHGADDVGGQQVGRELYAAELGVDELCKGLDGHRLSQSGHALQQDVSVAEQAYEKRLYQMLLPHNDLIHSRHKVCDESTLSLYAFVQFANVD